MPLETLAGKLRQWGYDGVELSGSGDHFDVEACLSSDRYARDKKDLLQKYGLKCYAISNHSVGQCICDDIQDGATRPLFHRACGDGKTESVQERAAQHMKNAVLAARLMDVDVITAFTGSSIWRKLYFWPPTPDEMIDAGYRDFAGRFTPIFDTFLQHGVKFALEVHPTEIAYDTHTMQKALEAVSYHPAFGVNFDPSHLVHQFVNPVKFLERFADRIFHMHVKDTRVNLDGENSILASHFNFGDPRRGWDFVSPGHGDVNWEQILRTLNRIGYQGPLTIEWEDCGMEREWGAQDALAMIKRISFPPSEQAFDAAFSKRV
jgi:sugar phosphate isomerase/epimerase